MKKLHGSPAKSTSVIITTYNNVGALRLTMDSLAYQTVKPSQVVICDDGSSSDVRDVVSRYVNFFDIVYCWQANRDFRAARSRNLGIIKSRASQVIFIDGDCMVPPRFVEFHQRIYSEKSIVYGGRVLLASSESETLMEEGIEKFNSICAKHWKLRYLPLGILRKITHLKWQGIKTCNLSVSSHLLRQIAGFDENYIGWGLEDSDLVARMLRTKDINIVNARFGGSVVHLYHEKSDRKSLSKNEALFLETLSDKLRVLPRKSVML